MRQGTTGKKLLTSRFTKDSGSFNSLSLDTVYYWIYLADHPGYPVFLELGRYMVPNNLINALQANLDRINLDLDKFEIHLRSQNEEQ